MLRIFYRLVLLRAQRQLAIENGANVKVVCNCVSRSVSELLCVPLRSESTSQS
jgi:hypothetical protein